VANNTVLKVFKDILVLVKIGAYMQSACKVHGCLAMRIGEYIRK